MSENNISEINNTEIKKERRGRPRTFVYDTEAEPREPRRRGRPVGTVFNTEKKMYESKDPAYVRRYYEQVKGAVKVCDICGLSCTDNHMKRHQESAFCKLAKLKQEEAAFDESLAINESA